MTWLMLLFASAGVFHHAGIKIPFFAFFAHDRGIRVREAPWNMLAAMAIAAFLCIGIGVWPAALYALLPYPVEYAPYTVEHVITQYQLLLFSALAFTWLIRTGLYPPELPSVNLDFDWLYRRLGPLVGRDLVWMAGNAWQRLVTWAWLSAVYLGYQLHRHHGPEGVFGRTLADRHHGVLDDRDAHALSGPGEPVAQAIMGSLAPRGRSAQRVGVRVPTP